MNCFIFAGYSFALLGMLFSFGGPKGPDMASQISQYGITWTFDKAYPVGQFVNGDWWVVGPVTVVSVSPAPGPSDGSDNIDASSIYGAPALQEDSRMRNGSMIITGPNFSDGDNTGYEKQGYDSRAKNYSAVRSVAFPCALAANRSLVSSISNTNLLDGDLKTPYVVSQYSTFLGVTPYAKLVLETAAVLTCLDRIPPDDAFRPSYVGTDKSIHRLSTVRWDLLPNLPALSSSPSWPTMARIFQRPWLDHIQNWIGQYSLPGQNGPVYGREFSRMSSIAALMLLQDVPQETKEPLMIGYLQLGIDLAGMAQNGRQWFSDGGHWQGRKWPILFASLMLDDPALRNFPKVDMAKHPYSAVNIVSNAALAAPTTIFQEDMDFYYGTGGDGQNALWQIVWHSQPRAPYQENSYTNFNSEQVWLDGYYNINVCALSGAALAAQLMGARQIWDNDAFFDHMDYWMLEANWWNRPSWLPLNCGKTYDRYLQDMWTAYREDVPVQSGGTNHVKWVWISGMNGQWISNPVP